MKSHNWRYTAGAALCCLMLMPAAWSQAQNPDASQMPIAADEPISPSGFPPLPSTLELPVTLKPAAWTHGRERRFHGSRKALSQANPDVSQSPIAADEPIAPSGFPPLPSTLELPITPTVSRQAESDFSNGRDYSDPKLHQGYKHDPFMDPRGVSRTGRGATSAPTPRRPATPSRAPSYYQKPSDPGLVREWDLPKGPQTAAPQPVTVDQSPTQDLSQPQQDDFQSRHIPAQQNGASSHKTLEQRLYRGLRVLNGKMNPY